MSQVTSSSTSLTSQCLRNEQLSCISRSPLVICARSDSTCGTIFASKLESSSSSLFRSTTSSGGSNFKHQQVFIRAVAQITFSFFGTKELTINARVCHYWKGIIDSEITWKDQGRNLGFPERLPMDVSYKQLVKSFLLDIQIRFQSQYRNSDVVSFEVYFVSNYWRMVNAQHSTEYCNHITYRNVPLKLALEILNNVPLNRDPSGDLLAEDLARGFPEKFKTFQQMETTCPSCPPKFHNIQFQQFSGVFTPEAKRETLRWLAIKPIYQMCDDFQSAKEAIQKKIAGAKPLQFLNNIVLEESNTEKWTRQGKHKVICQRPSLHSNKVMMGDHLSAVT